MISFSNIIASYPEKHQALADRFEVNISTVKRWATGVAIPLPILREVIINTLNCLCGKCIWCKDSSK